MSEAPEIYVVPQEGVPMSWAVEQIDSDGDGGIDVAVFSGPHAVERAKGYAALLRHDPDRVAGY